MVQVNDVDFYKQHGWNGSSSGDGFHERSRTTMSMVRANGMPVQDPDVDGPNHFTNNTDGNSSFSGDSSVNDRLL
jgi:hypothetical protein